MWYKTLFFYNLLIIKDIQSMASFSRVKLADSSLFDHVFTSVSSHYCKVCDIILKLIHNFVNFFS